MYEIYKNPSILTLPPFNPESMPYFYGMTAINVTTRPTQKKKKKSPTQKKKNQ